MSTVIKPGAAPAPGVMDPHWLHKLLHPVWFGLVHSALIRELHHALFSRAGAAEDPLTAAFRALLRRFIQDGRDAGEFPVPDPDLTTAFLLAGLHAVLTEGLHKTSTATTVAAAQKLARRTLSA